MLNRSLRQESTLIKITVFLELVKRLFIRQPNIVAERKTWRGVLVGKAIVVSLSAQILESKHTIPGRKFP